MNFARKPMKMVLSFVVGTLAVFGTDVPILAQEVASNVYQGDDIFEAVDDAQSIEREIERINQTREALQRRREVAASNAAYYADWEGQIAEQRTEIAEGWYVEQRLEYISRLEEHGPHLAASYPEYLRLLDNQITALDVLETTGRAFIASGGQIGDPSFAPAREAYRNYSGFQQEAEAYRSTRIRWRHLFVLSARKRVSAESARVLAHQLRRTLASRRLVCVAYQERPSCSEAELQAAEERALEAEQSAIEYDNEASAFERRATQIRDAANSTSQR